MFQIFCVGVEPPKTDMVFPSVPGGRKENDSDLNVS